MFFGGKPIESLESSEQRRLREAKEVLLQEKAIDDEGVFKQAKIKLEQAVSEQPASQG